jgi:metal-responsive CopG/Arc/MetJ family transcriptional regulator
MSTAVAMRKITISLPGELVAFADRRAEETHTSRSQIISWVLAEAKARAEARLAAEGYQFYAQEAAEFAAASEGAVAESWPVEAWDDCQSEGMNHACAAR